MNHNSDDQQRAVREQSSPLRGDDVGELMGDLVPASEYNAAWVTAIERRLSELKDRIVTTIPWNEIQQILHTRTDESDVGSIQQRRM